MYVEFCIWKLTVPRTYTPLVCGKKRCRATRSIGVESKPHQQFAILVYVAGNHQVAGQRTIGQLLHISASYATSDGRQVCQSTPVGQKNEINLRSSFMTRRRSFRHRLEQPRPRVFSGLDCNWKSHFLCSGGRHRTDAGQFDFPTEMLAS
jgi:hypothetical protein